jgi:uncharacterized protein YbcI
VSGTPSTETQSRPAESRQPRAERSDHGQTLAAISRRIVGLLKEYSGKGPTKARTYLSGDMVVVLLADGYTQVEKTLMREGRTRTVIEQRAEFQEVMRGRFKRVIEEELQREVLAFMSANHHKPDLNAEIFVLAPLQSEESILLTAALEGVGEPGTAEEASD